MHDTSGPGLFHRKEKGGNKCAKGYQREHHCQRCSMSTEEPEDP
jgi:hypothetical protein